MVIIKITTNGAWNQIVGVCLLFIARTGFELDWKRRKGQLSHLLDVISLLEIGNRLTTAEEKPGETSCLPTATLINTRRMDLGRLESAQEQTWEWFPVSTQLVSLWVDAAGLNSGLQQSVSVYEFSEVLATFECKK